MTKLQREDFMKKITTFILVLALLVGVTSMVSAEVTLRHWDWHQPRMNLKLEYIEEYEEMNPDVTIDTQVIGWDDYWTKLMSGIAGGDVPDIAQFHNSQTNAFLNHLEAFPNELFDYDQYKQDIVNFEAAYLFDGKFHFYPVGMMSGLIFYNKDIWSEAGYTESDIPRTWEEFNQIAKDLTKYDDNGDIQTAGFVPNGILGVYWLDLHYQLGGNLYGENAETVNWNNEAGVEALSFIEKMIFEDKVTEPGFLAFNEAMGTGHAGMVYSWSWLGGELNNNYPDLNWGVFRLPTFDGSLAPGPVARNNHETGMAVMKSSDQENKDEAFKFLKWLYEDTDYLVEANLILGTAPANVNLLEDPRIKNNKLISAIAEQVPYTNIPGESPHGVENNYGLGMLEELLFFGSSAEQALETAEFEANQVLEENPVEWYVEDLYTPPAE
jgi:multiple sugar transport system substrate-binding protein